MNNNENEWRQKNYKKIASERLYDACALYEGERFLASFYLAGYVLEIGIKEKLIVLGNIRLQGGVSASWGRGS